MTHLCLFGAPLDTGNLGVSALGLSTLMAIAQRDPHAHVTLFDDGWGQRGATLPPAKPHDPAFAYHLLGARYSHRVYRPESIWNMRLAAFLGHDKHPALAALHAANAVLDIAGGDSFTDLNGAKRFHAVTSFQQLALQVGTPLILLPQTYGPFLHAHSRRVAAGIVTRAAMAWARDLPSFQALRELLGKRFDPKIHKAGIDVAFQLPADHPRSALPATIEHWLRDRPRPVIGVNISGLIFHDPVAAAKQYHLLADYRQVVLTFLRLLLQKTDFKIVLIPHVLTPPGHHESDSQANVLVQSELALESQQRLAVLPPMYNPCETKWIISHLDWFCGTRMHANIAALSSGVPAAAIAYSPKAAGIFEACDQLDYVADPRSLSTPAMLERLFHSFTQRAIAKARLAAALPAIRTLASTQFDQILSFAATLHPAHTTASLERVA